jgi:SNF2 family DNA or RNA helicase
MQKTFAELNDKGDRIEVHFSYDKDNVRAIKAVPGRKFVSVEQGGPFWTVSCNLSTARRLREEFGDNLTLGEALKQWGREQLKQEQNLHTLARQDDWPIDQMKLAKKLPELVEWMRGYQRADAMFLSETSAVNANEQGLGKTAETIAAIWEADLEHGPHLVVCPKTSMETVWQAEVERWTGQKVFCYSGEYSKKDREIVYEDVQECIEQGEPFWFVCTADTIRRGLEPDIEWATFTIDEYHKTGLAEPKNKFPKNVKQVKSTRRYALSGTPIGGKPIKLWGALNFVDPTSFTSRWNWAEQWLVIRDNGFGKEVMGILPGREEQFYKEHARYLVRRLKSEVLPQLPPKQYVDVWCPMTSNQAKQYRQFAEDAEIRIDERHLAGAGILSEYSRLKVFADAYCPHVEEVVNKCSRCRGIDPHCQKCDGTGKVTSLKLKPSSDSGKLPFLLERLAESGIDPDEPVGDAQAVIGSQFREVVDVVHEWLNERGISAAKITGEVKLRDRVDIQKAFQAGEGARVVVMTTTAGGVSINLDRASTVHILDETWVPDDQEQLADRVHRASRIHQVTVYTYRSRNTIEEFIHETIGDKAITNRNILDLRRQGFRSVPDVATPA